MPILSCVKLQFGCGLELTASDGDRFCSSIVDYHGGVVSGIRIICVNAAVLENLVAACGEQITLELTASHLIIRSGKSESKLPIQDAKDFPNFPSLEKMKPVAANLSDLGKAIKQVAWCALDDPGRPVLESVHIKLSPTKMLVESCSGRQFAFINQSAICGDAEFIIPDDDASLISNALETASELLASDNAIAIKSENGVLWAKLREGPYPKAPDSFYNAKLERVAVLEREPLIRFCETALNLPLKNITSGSRLKLTFDFGSCVLELYNSEVPHRDELGGGEVSHSFLGQTKYILNAVRCFESDTIEVFRVAKGDSIGMTMGSDAALFIKSGELTTVTMPLRE